MMSEKKVLIKSAIEDFQQYECENFNWLFTLLQDNGFYLSNSLKKIKSIIPNIDKAIWQPWRKALPIETSNDQISGHTIIHQGMHYLLWMKLNKKTEGYPKFTLLNETLACGSNFYFCLHYLNTKGIEHPFTQRELALYRDSYDGTREELALLINKVRKNAFFHFRSTVLELFEFCLLLKDISLDYKIEPEKASSMISKKIKSFSYWPFISRYDFQNFIAYTLAHLGKTSLPEDELIVKKIIELLFTADSYIEFLNSVKDHKINLNVA